MRSSRTGGPGTQSRTSTAGTTEELPEEIQRDVDRVSELVATGFTGRLWQQTADELFGYTFKPLVVAMRHTDTLMALVKKSNTPLKMSDQERSSLHRNSADREDLAVRTIYVALETFPALLKRGGYAPAANRGKNGRPAKLTSFFYQRCGLVFTRVFYTWRTEREDRFERQARRYMSPVPGRPRPGPGRPRNGGRRRRRAVRHPHSHDHRAQAAGPGRVADDPGRAVEERDSQPAWHQDR